MKTVKTTTTVTAAIHNSEETTDTVRNITKEEDGNTALIEGFKRMENAVVELRTDLIRKVDQTTQINVIV